MPEEEEKTLKILETLTAKIDELNKEVKGRKQYTEGKIKENPLAYVAGAFAGGLIVGYLTAKIEKCT